MFGGASGSNRDLKWRRHFSGSMLLIQLFVGFIILFKSRQNLFGLLFSSSANRLILFPWYIRFALYTAFLNHRLSRIYSFCLSVCLSVLLSVTPFWLCSHHCIIMKFSGVITKDRGNVHAKGKGSRSKVKLTEITTQLSRFRTVTPVLIQIWW